MNVIAQLEYELAYYDSAVHLFNHYTTRTPLVNWRDCIFFLIIQDHIRQKSRMILDFGWSVQPNPRYTPDFASREFHLFSFSSKMLCMTTNFFKKIRGKCLWKSSWAQNQLNVAREELISHLINGNSWSKIMANILFIEIYSQKNYTLLKR